jgi:hypothetical protein
MSNTAAIVLVNMILRHMVAIGVDANTIDLVDNNGFAANPIRRFQEVAIDRFGATREQAFYAVIAWVKAGRPSRPVAA